VDIDLHRTRMYWLHEAVESKEPRRWMEVLADEGAPQTHALWTATPLLDDDGVCFGCLIDAADVTDLVRAHVDLEGRYQKLEMFSHSAAHTLKTDWQVTSLLVDEVSALLEESRDGGEWPVEDIEALLAELGPRAAKGVQTVRDLLVYATATGKPQLEPLSLRDMVQGVAARVGSPLIRGAGDLPDDLVGLDAGTFPIALLQLVENAVKYGEDKPVEISYANRKLRVQDHGRGIPPESLQQIFEIFKRIARDVSGTGLGLAIAKQIIDAHGYRVWAESEGPGKGSAFVIDFGQMDGPAIAGKAGGA
jgi:signal transduction histidine kinase